MSDTTAGTLDTRADAGKGQDGVVQFWLQSIEIAEREERDWRDSAELTEAIYKGGTKDNAKSGRRFNILYSNTETLAAAIYNSTPVPDIRRRFGEQDDVSRNAATVIERALSYSMDQYDVDATYRDAVRNSLVAGRGILRVKYYPVLDGETQIVDQKVACESVDWRSFIRGPARVWADVPWIAFRHYLSRDELKKINPTVGATIKLDHTLPEANKETGRGDNLPDIYKRAPVLEIWDKERREVLFIADSHKSEPLLVVPDPLGLADFFPVPRPMQPVEIPGSLIPVEPYQQYKGLADELETLTRRAGAIMRAIKWRGAYADPALGDFLTKFKDLDDGEMAPMDNPMAVQNGGLDKAFWFQPVKEAAEVLMKVYEAREQTKQAIYEITGIADLLRGASVASETATAQNIKAQWGSLRVSVMQNDVQRVARDIMRLKAEIIAEKFEPQILMAIAAMQIDEQVIGMLKSDPLRRYRIDVETDSTIRADLQRQQQNIGGFITGLGPFLTSMGPAVQAGAIPMEVAKTMLQSFSRTYKLGRAVEEALDTIPNQAPQQADPAAAEQAKAQASQQAEMAKMQGAMQIEQGKAQVAMQAKQMDIDAARAIKEMEIGAANELAMAKLQTDAQLQSEKLAFEREKFTVETALKQAEMQMNALAMDTKHEQDEKKFEFDADQAEVQAIASGVERSEDGTRKPVDRQAKMTDLMAKNDERGSKLEEMMAEAMKAIKAPKRVVRDNNNRVTGIEAVVMN